MGHDHDAVRHLSGKVVASDRRDNPPAEAFEAAPRQPSWCRHAPAADGDRQVVGVEGDQAMLDAAPPTRSVRFVGVVRGQRQEVDERLSRRRPVRQQDGTFRFKTDVLRPGTHVVCCASATRRATSAPATRCSPCPSD